MTGFIGNTACMGELGGSGFQALPDDDRLAQFWWYSKFEWNLRPEKLWPRTQYRGSEGRVSTAPLNSAPDIWDWRVWADTDAGAGQRRNIVTGITTDAVGTPLGSCRVKLYETASDTIVDTGVLSDPITGVYVATTPFSTACYAVAYKTGSPDREGTTVNTLTPA